jgi:hypothetical protein
MTDTTNRDKNCHYGFDFFIEQSDSDREADTVTCNELYVGKTPRKWEVTCSNKSKTKHNSGLFFTAISGNRLTNKR